MLRIATEKQTPFACKATKSEEKKNRTTTKHIYICIYIFLAATVVLE